MIRTEYELLKSVGYITEPPVSQISAGIFRDCNDMQYNYTLVKGFTFDLLANCNGWKSFVIQEIMKFSQNYSGSEPIENVLPQKIMLEDYHWDWFKKTPQYMSNSYSWFFLLINNIPEAVAITYIPKSSILTSSEIFYFEYISAAPWNRKSDLHSQKFRGIGTLTMKEIQRYMVKENKIQYGFSLHSLPQAESFYAKIGMQRLNGYEKESLSFFEMPSNNSLSFCGVA